MLFFLKKTTKLISENVVPFGRINKNKHINTLLLKRNGCCSLRGTKNSYKHEKRKKNRGKNKANVQSIAKQIQSNRKESLCTGFKKK